MMSSIRQVLFLLALTSASANAADRIDDSQSPIQRVETDIVWEHDMDQDDLSETEFNATIARVPNFEIRLDTSSYMGQQVRIFLGLPARISGLRGSHGFQMDWTTQGVFDSGSATPGTRQLIFQGQVTMPMMIEVFNLKLHIDGRNITGGLIFDPQFEIEII